MSHPLLNLPRPLCKRLFWLSLVLTALSTLVLQLIDRALHSAAAPQGIVSYELAGHAATAAKILASWDANARLHAAFSLGFDHLYILAYVITLTLAALGLAAAHSGIIRSIGIILAWGMGVAGLADVLENYLLWRMLILAPTETAAMTARWAALLKFTLILLTFGYLVTITLLNASRKMKKGHYT